MSPQVSIQIGKMQIPPVWRTRSPFLSSSKPMYQAMVLFPGKDHDPVSLRRKLCEWYCLACSRNIYPEHLGKVNLKASNWVAGPLKKIVQLEVNEDQWRVWRCEWRNCGFFEGNDSRACTRICENFNETGWFWRALPDHAFVQKGSQCRDVKKVKQRIIVALVAMKQVGKKVAL